jgi:hypothetical protein
MGSIVLRPEGVYVLSIGQNVGSVYVGVIGWCLGERVGSIEFIGRRLGALVYTALD